MFLLVVETQILSEKFRYRQKVNDRAILGSLSKQWTRWEGVGKYLIFSDPPFLFFFSRFSLKWFIIGFLLHQHYIFLLIWGGCCCCWKSFVTQKMFLLHDLLPRPVTLKSPETVAGLQDLAKKLKLFPLSRAPSVPMLSWRKKNTNNKSKTFQHLEGVLWKENRAKKKLSYWLVIESNTLCTLAQWPSEKRPEPIYPLGTKL